MSAKTLMIQGTGSGVGKSVITAAFCRKFFLDGLRVAPFKAQNMSLNSYVTEDGGEMGRAQVYQAEACGIKPCVNMNPVLLKPMGDNLSQVVVLGRAVETRNARDYFNGRGKYIPEVKKALETLMNEYEVVVLEGAGSPAEINLRAFDFVNMKMAEAANAPVIIVGDIDRGGVFAWMKGTYDLLAPDEKERVAGFIVNKFRGDLKLLESGLRMFEEMTGKPILGVIPFYRDLYVDEEDGIPHANNPVALGGPSILDVAVLRLPRISNFTDMAPLVYDPSVSLRYVWSPEQMGNPDLIILPGTKNTLDDLEFLNAQGLSKAILDRGQNGSVLLGICGGFQMLGTEIRNPHKVESQTPRMKGFGLFEMDTALEKEKITRQLQAVALPGPVFTERLAVRGYEIHMGKIRFNASYPSLFANEDGAEDGALGICDESGMVMGTFVHGFLDEEGLRRDFLRHVRKIRGKPEPESQFDYQAHRQKGLDRLGRIVADHIDMDRVHKIMA